jgi:hypothetical protein
MHEYDVALKNILTRPGSSILAQLTGASSLRWINVEAPKVTNRRVDRLGELPDRNLVHIELQSRNEKDFPLRMAEYLFGIGRQYGRLPRQVALYVGEAPLRMKDRVDGPGVSVRFHLVDIRDLDGKELLASPHLGDNVLAVLTRLSERPKAELLILARLRRLSGEVKREADKMPITEDIMDHDVIGPAIRQGRAEGQVEMLLSMIQKRFGRVPATVAQRVAALKPAQLKRAGLRLLDAQHIEDLFAR